MFELGDNSAAIRAGVRLQLGLRIRMRDGVTLSAHLYHPKRQNQARSAICTLTPYTAQLWHDYAVYFAGRGFLFLVVDCRGRGNSGGEFMPFTHDGSDGYDVIEWLASQPCCNGRVAMWGGSYAAYNQWMTAREHPPHLTTIVPAAAAYVGVDMPIQKNIAAPFLMQWLTLVFGRTLQERLFFNTQLFWGALFKDHFRAGLPFRRLDQFVGNPSGIFQEWLRHPTQCEYWDQRNPSAEDYAQMQMPVLTITGHCDSDQPGALTHYRNHIASVPKHIDAQHHLIMGPWDHTGTRVPKTDFCGISAGPASLLDLQQLQVEWYAWVMNGAPKPAFLQNNVAYYVMVADQWKYAPSLKSVTARHATLYLQGSNNPKRRFLSEQLNDTPAGEYQYNPYDTRFAGLESSMDPENRADDRLVQAMGAQQLIYYSTPFEDDVEVSGFFRLTAWISIDQPDTDFRAGVYEVSPDGGAVLLSADRVRARYRADLRCEALVTTTEALRYEFDQFSFISRLIKRGHRLRLVVGPLNSIYSQKNYNSGLPVADECMKDARVVRVRVFHDTQHPSALQVPIARNELN